MGTVATIIIEPRLLVRKALESLLENHSYRFVFGAASSAEIESSSVVGEGPRLVLLGGQSIDNAVAEAVSIRKWWSDSKIVLLFENISAADFQRLAASHLDGCVPLSVSPHTLISTLDLVMIRDVRVMVVGDTKGPSTPPDQNAGPDESTIGKFQANGTKQDTMPAAAVPQHSRPRLIGTGLSGRNMGNGDAQSMPPLSHFPKLSEREAQILDGLVKGHANKVIARTCDIAEATVKVHMKSILRKIHVGNRTQAAIWALEHGFCCDGIKGWRLTVADSDAEARPAG
jgi:two-component system nitrate/nitrite response regulator NarL